MQDIYGAKVKVAFIDTKTTGLKDYPSIAQVAQMGYPFPVVAVNGKPRLAGGIDIAALQAIIDAGE